MQFATELNEPAFAARPVTRTTDARVLARDILQMSPDTYAAAFRGSAIKRAKLWMLRRNACVVLGNVGTADDLSLFESLGARDDDVVPDHAAWAIRRIQ